MTPPLDPTVTVRQGDRTAWRLIDGKAVVVVIDAQRMHVLNPVGARVWELCDGRNVASIVDHITREFEVDEETALRDVARFISELNDVGAVQLSAEPVR